MATKLEDMPQHDLNHVLRLCYESCGVHFMEILGGHGNSNKHDSYMKRFYKIRENTHQRRIEKEERDRRTQQEKERKCIVKKVADEIGACLTLAPREASSAASSSEKLKQLQQRSLRQNSGAQKSKELLAGTAQAAYDMNEEEQRVLKDVLLMIGKRFQKAEMMKASVGIATIKMVRQSTVSRKSNQGRKGSQAQRRGEELDSLMVQKKKSDLLGNVVEMTKAQTFNLRIHKYNLKEGEETKLITYDELEEKVVQRVKKGVQDSKRTNQSSSSKQLLHNRSEQSRCSHCSRQKSRRISSSQHRSQLGLHQIYTEEQRNRTEQTNRDMNLDVRQRVKSWVTPKNFGREIDGPSYGIEPLSKNLFKTGGQTIENEKKLTAQVEELFQKNLLKIFQKESTSIDLSPKMRFTRRGYTSLENHHARMLINNALTIEQQRDATRTTLQKPLFDMDIKSQRDKGLSLSIRKEEAANMRQSYDLHKIAQPGGRDYLDATRETAGRQLTFQPPSQEIANKQESDNKYRMAVIRNIIQQRQKRIKQVGRILDGKKPQPLPVISSFDGSEAQRVEVPVSGSERTVAAVAKPVKGGYKPPQSHYDTFQLRHTENSFNILQEKFMRYLKDNDMLECSLESSQKVRYNKFDREIDPVTVECKQKMFRPRDELKKQGLPIPGVEKVITSLRKRWSDQDDSVLSEQIKGLEIDSLIESAFCSEENVDWEKYRLDIEHPPCSEVSQEQYVIYQAEKKDDMSEQHDQLSDVNDSGTDMSEETVSDFGSVNDQIKNGEDRDLDKELKRKQQIEENLQWYPNRNKVLQHFKQIHENGWSRFGNYRVIRGLKLPMTEGDGTQKYTIEDMIRISQKQMEVFRRFRPRKTLSTSLLESILAIYQEEMKCQPLDLIAKMMSCGPLIRNYWLSDAQLNSIALTLPYFINIRFVNFENCGMKDKQAGYIMMACQGLKKLNTVSFAQNQVGSQFVKSIKDDHLQKCIKDFSLKSMKESAPFMALVVEKLKAYSQLKSLDLSGNVLSKEAADHLSDLAQFTTTLESLNLSGCLQAYQPAKRAFRGLSTNRTLCNLNLSCNNFRHIEYEFGSSIGRLIQVHPRLLHLNIQCCKLIQEEIFFISYCMRWSGKQTLQAVHMGFNNISHVGRLVTRSILNARVKYPFRASVQICEHIKTAQDKNMVLVLNSYVLSSLPSDLLASVLGGNRVTKPLTSSRDALVKLQQIMEVDQKKIEDEAMERRSSAVQAMMEDADCLDEVHAFKKKAKNSLKQKLDSILQKCGDLRGDIEEATANQQQQKEVQNKISKQIYKQLLQEYFQSDPDQRSHDLIQTMDFYGKKFDLFTKSKGNLTIQDFMNELSYAKQNAPRMSGIQSRRQKSMASRVGLAGINKQNVVKLNKKLDIMPIKVGKRKPKKFDAYERSLDPEAGQVREQNNRECMDHEFHVAIEEKHDRQLRRDLLHMLDQFQWKMSNEQKEYVRSLFCWADLFTSLDRCFSDDLLQQNPLRQIASDMVFQRVVGQSEIFNAEAAVWKDSSDCWICDKHSKVYIEIGERTEIIDQEFQEVMQISEVINNDSQELSKLMGAPGHEQDPCGHLLPVYEDMLEQMFEQSQYSSQPSLHNDQDNQMMMLEDAGQTAQIQEPNRSPINVKDMIGHHEYGFNPPESSLRNSLFHTTCINTPLMLTSQLVTVNHSVESTPGRLHPEYSSSTSYVKANPIFKLPRQSFNARSEHPRKLAQNPSLAKSSLEQFYNFTHEHQYTHVVPISVTPALDEDGAKQKRGVIPALATSNAMLYHPQISAAPLSAGTISKALYPKTQFSAEAIAEFNKHARGTAKLRANHGVVYRDIMVRSDDDDDLDTDDDLEDITPRRDKKMIKHVQSLPQGKHNENYAERSLDRVINGGKTAMTMHLNGHSEQSSNHENMAMATAYDDRGYIRLDDFKNDPDEQETVDMPMGTSYLKSHGDYMSGQGQSSKLLDFKTRASTMNQQKSALGSNYKPTLLYQDQSGSNVNLGHNSSKQAYEVVDYGQQTFCGDVSRNTAQNNSVVSKNFQTEQRGAFNNGREIISEEATRRPQDVAQDAGDESEEKRLWHAPSKSITPATAHSRLRRRKESNQGKNRGSMAASFSKYAGASTRPYTTMHESAASRDPLPTCRPEDFLSMHSIRQVVQKTQKKREKEFNEGKVQKKEEEKIQAKWKKWGRNRQFHQPEVDEEGKKWYGKTSGFDKLIDFQRNWYHLRKTDKASRRPGEKTMYLMASFNHWFPLKMTFDDTQPADTATGEGNNVDDGIVSPLLDVRKHAMSVQPQPSKNKSEMQNGSGLVYRAPTRALNPNSKRLEELQPSKESSPDAGPSIRVSPRSNGNAVEGKDDLENRNAKAAAQSKEQDDANRIQNTCLTKHLRAHASKHIDRNKRGFEGIFDKQLANQTLPAETMTSNRNKFRDNMQHFSKRQSFNQDQSFDVAQSGPRTTQNDDQDTHQVDDYEGKKRGDQDPEMKIKQKLAMNYEYKGPAKDRSFSQQRVQQANLNRLSLTKQQSTIYGQRGVASLTHARFKFGDYVPPGTHFFYFIKDGRTFCLSRKFDVALFPGTNVQMNTLVVPERHCLELPSSLTNKAGTASKK